MASSSADDSPSMSPYLTILIVFSALVAVAGGVYLSGAGDDFFKYLAERFFKAKATAEEKALEHAGEDKTQAFLKDQLKKNPVVSNDELNDISGGLGDEAAKEMGTGQLKGGVGGMAKGIGNAFD